MHLRSFCVQHCLELNSFDECLCAIIPSFCVQHCLDLNSPDPGVGELLKLVCKAFYSATYMGVPPYLLRPHPFAQWMTCFHTLLLRPVPKVSSALLEVCLYSFAEAPPPVPLPCWELAVLRSARQTSAQHEQCRLIKLHGAVVLRCSPELCPVAVLHNKSVCREPLGENLTTALQRI